ncbi:MAG: AAA family ATPase, partial [Thermoplasmataceae archaeon]
SKIRNLSEKLEGLNSQLSVLESEFDRVQEELRNTSKEAGSKTGEITALQRSLESGRRDIAEVDAKIGEITTLILSVEKEESEMQGQLGEIKRNIQSLENEKQQVYDLIKQLSPAYYTREQDLQEQLEGLRAKESEFTGEVSKLEAEGKFIMEKISEMKSKLADLNASINARNSDIRDHEISLAACEAELGKLRSMEAEIDRKTGELSKKIGEIEASIRDDEDKIADLKAMQSTKRDMIVTLQAKCQVFGQRLTEINEEMEKNAGKIITDVRSVQEAKRQISDVQGKVEGLGPVNQLAIQEFADVSRDLDSLNGEIENLTSERSALIKLLNDLNERKERVFMETFNGINGKMGSIYNEISGGGEAFLELSDPSRPLESEIFIKARPKGTRFSKIEALSGGEKSLTALSFILAVQRTNPSSVYFLDEVDMFLDAANAERMAKMFRANASKSQIIMVSLKQIVTKYANSLIGVTSQDGINSEVFERVMEEEIT